VWCHPLELRVKTCQAKWETKAQRMKQPTEVEASTQRGIIG
jgi:hypothetical protein